MTDSPLKDLITSIVVLDVGMKPSSPFLFSWLKMGREYGEWAWVGRYYE